MADNSVIVTLEIETDGAKKQIDATLRGITTQSKQASEKIEGEIGAAFGSASKSASAFGDTIKAVFTGTLAANFAMSVVASIKEAFSAGINSALDQEKANQRLIFSLKQTGEFSESAYNSVLNYANAMEALSNISDDVIIKGVATARTFGASTEQAMQATSAALGLSKAIGVDFETALVQVSATLNGDIGRLGKYSESLKSLSKEALQAGKGVEALNNEFGKFVGSDLDSLAGQSASLSTALGNLGEAIADLVLSFKPASSGLKDFINSMTEGVQGLKVLINGAEGTEGTYQQLDRINQEIDRVNANIERYKKSVVDPSVLTQMKASLGELMLERTRLTDQLKASSEQERVASQASLEVQRKNLADAALAKQEADQKMVLSEYAREQQILQAKMIGVTDQKLIDENKFAQDQLALATAFQNKLLTEEEYLIQRDLLQANYDKMRAEKAFQADESIGASFQKAAMGMKMTMGDLAKNVTSMAVNGFGRAFQQMGAAMAQGQNAFKAFGQAVKGLLADIASAVGDYFIKTGIAVALTPPQYGGNPAQGAAMIAAGAAIKTFAGFLGASGGGTASQGGGIAPSGATITTPEAQNTIGQQERVEQGPRVNVTIQGDVLDSQESGLRIVQLINDAFDQNGAVLTPRMA